MPADEAAQKTMHPQPYVRTAPDTPLTQPGSAIQSLLEFRQRLDRIARQFERLNPTLGERIRVPKQDRGRLFALRGEVFSDGLSPGSAVLARINRRALLDEHARRHAAASLEMPA